jgi:hypothetical protein
MKNGFYQRRNWRLMQPLADILDIHVAWRTRSVAGILITTVSVLCSFRNFIILNPEVSLMVTENAKNWL